MTELYKYRKSHHLCTQCGKQDERTLSGRILCESCYNKAATTRRYRTEKRLKKHQCILCGKIDARTLAGHQLCEYHADYYRQRYERRKNGIN